MKPVTAALMFSLAASLSPALSAAGLPQPTPVSSVNLSQYSGRWYEVSRTPNLFEINCTCVTATYSPKTETSIGVFNACNKGNANGRLDTITGTGTVTDPAKPAELKIMFDEGAPFPADYWIVDLVPDSSNSAAPYKYATVSGPSGTTLFILSRDPQLDTPQEQADYAAILQRLAAQGLPIGRLRNTPQPLNCNYDAQVPGLR